MALSPQEFEKLKARLSTNSQPVNSADIQPQGTSGAGGFIKGATKSLVGTAVDTARLLQTGGQGILAGVDPTRSYEQIKKETGFKSLNTDTKDGAYVKEALTPKGSSEKAGAVAEIAAELIIPTKIAGSVVAKGIGKVLPDLKNISILGKEAGVLSKVQDAVTPIEKGVESVLNPTVLIPKEKLVDVPVEKIVAQSVDKGKKLELYLKQAQKAVNDFSQPTPLEIAGQRAEQALNVLNNKLTKQGQLKKSSLGEVGKKVLTNVGQFREEIAKDLTDKIGLNVDRLTGELLPVKGRISKIALDPEDNKLVRSVYSQLQTLGKNPTVQQVDDAIDAIQDLLYKRKSNVAVPVNGQVEGLLKSNIGKLNNAVKKVAGEQYRKANDKFSYFIDFRDKLNKALGVDATKGGSLMKRVFSPTDGGTKELFNKIKDLTGIDLIEDATLAKFVMENVGDARQASLLEEIIKGRLPSKGSFIQQAAEKTIGKIQNPINKAKRVIKKNTTR